MSDAAPYDSLLLVSFGGPEGPDDVMPFLENVLRGKNVPRERMLEVSEHYQHFGGVSPINEQCRQLLAALREELAKHGPDLPIYWGNRNWDPMLEDTVRQMAADGRKRAIAFFTSVFSCYSGCRQYREDILRAREAVGDEAPAVDKLRMPYNHPAFIGVNAENLKRELDTFDESDRDSVRVLFTAHSIPDAMADNCRYATQLEEASRLTADAVGHANWELVYQSRSGPPQQPWLEPDVCDRIEQLHEQDGVKRIVLLPIGFVSDHMEVLFDLDTEAKELCEKLGVEMRRAATVGVDPRFVSMVRELILERAATVRGEEPTRPAIGHFPANHDVCPQDCCLYTPRRPPGVGRPAGAGRPASEDRPESTRPEAGQSESGRTGAGQPA
ncbi:MAG: ferrochelatase [Planctomycetota bacterium]